MVHWKIVTKISRATYALRHARDYLLIKFLGGLLAVKKPYLIHNYQYWLIFCLSVLAHLRMLVADYLLIKFLGGFLVVKKPYLIQTLKLTL